MLDGRVPYDDPNVVQLREKLNRHNGIKGLEVLDPNEVQRAADLFHRDGFVVVRDLLGPEQLARLKAATERALEAMLAVDPTCAAGGGAGGLPHRFSFGSSSASRHMLHEDEWVDLVDMPTTTPILQAIFGSPNYILIGAGGDVAMPGAIEYQGLHSDNVWTEPHDPTGRVSIREMPVPAVTINFPMVDLTPENGPDSADPRHAELTCTDPEPRQRAGVDETQHRVPSTGRQRDLPRPALLARRHSEPVARGPRGTQHRILCAVVPQ